MERGAAAGGLRWFARAAEGCAHSTLPLSLRPYAFHFPRSLGPGPPLDAVASVWGRVQGPLTRLVRSLHARKISLHVIFFQGLLGQSRYALVVMPGRLFSLVRGPRGALAPALSSWACAWSRSRALLHTDAFPDHRESRPEYSAGYPARPLFSQAARRRRLEVAVEACARGEEFKVPKPELSATPGACGAIMNILRENGGPMLSAEIMAVSNERWPGVIKSRTHLKQVCMNGLINKARPARISDPCPHPNLPHRLILQCAFFGAL